MMAAAELSLEEIHEYFVQRGGIVSNRDCVRHFRRYLTDPSNKDDARIKFKKFVNMLATTKTEGDEKFLILRSKFSAAPDLQTALFFPTSPQCDPRNSIGIPTSPTSSLFDFSPISSPVPRQPPPYRPPPPPPPVHSSPQFSNSASSLQDSPVPKAPPRRKTPEKQKIDIEQSTPSPLPAGSDDKENEALENKQPVSVKERTQKFNRLASHEEDSSPRHKEKKKQIDKKGADEEDGGASVASLDPKRCAEWYVAAAKCDYHVLAKMAQEEPRLVKLKDPFTAYTVLHWGAKHGNPDVIKLFAGTYKAHINARSNGGYTPLHIAAKFGRMDVFRLMKEVYNADLEIRDFSGRKPSQYISSQSQIKGIKDTHKIKGRKKQTDKDLGFLRIGSLNVRVKKTTEAFSNFLGVGGNSINPVDPVSDKVHKGWGSADNVGQDNVMAPPKGYNPKRKSKRPLETSGTSSTPGTPSQIQRNILHRNSLQDSDSDSAAGFDSQWKN